MELRLWKKGASLHSASTASKRERQAAGVSVTRFCELTGIPRATWYRWRAAGASSPGPWSTPAQDRVEADAKALAAAWEGWGHRKLAELKRVGIDDIAPAAVSDSTMYRVLSRNGLCLPANYTAEVRQAAGVRRETFVHPPQRRSRLWQADFSEYETATGAAGTSRVSWTTGPRSTWACACKSPPPRHSDAIAVLEAALADVEALTDPTTGEIGTLRLVTDNGSCFNLGAASGPGSPPNATSPTSAPAGARRGPTASSSASSQPSNTNTSTARRSPPAPNSPTTSPATGRSTTRSDPTKPSPCAGPSTATKHPDHPTPSPENDSDS